jgi:hypothetical protein
MRRTIAPYSRRHRFPQIVGGQAQPQPHLTGSRDCIEHAERPAAVLRGVSAAMRGSAEAAGFLLPRCASIQVSMFR